jgi:hypothetical protein
MVGGRAAMAPLARKGWPDLLKPEIASSGWSGMCDTLLAILNIAGEGSHLNVRTVQILWLDNKRGR